MRQPAGLALAAALLLAGLGLLAPGAPAFAQEGWRQFIVTDRVGFITAGASSQLVENDDWTKYAPRCLFDGNKDSAWVEGVEADGLGEQVWFTVDRGTADLILTNGFARNASLFQKNNRVKRLEATLWVGATAEVTVSELGRVYWAKPASGGLALPLADWAAPQALALPLDWDALPVNPEELVREFRAAFEWTEEVPCWAEYILCLEIKEVNRGTAYRDTCIAEIAWTVPREASGPSGTRAFDLAGCWQARSGAAWDFLLLKGNPGYPLSFYLYEEDGQELGSGHWRVGDGKLTLESYIGDRAWIYTDGQLAGGLLELISEDGRREGYVRMQEDSCLWD